MPGSSAEGASPEAVDPVVVHASRGVHCVSHHIGVTAWRTFVVVVNVVDVVVNVVVSVAVVVVIVVVVSVVNVVVVIVVNVVSVVVVFLLQPS